MTAASHGLADRGDERNARDAERSFRAAWPRARSAPRSRAR